MMYRPWAVSALNLERQKKFVGQSEYCVLVQLSFTCYMYVLWIGTAVLLRAKRSGEYCACVCGQRYNCYRIGVNIASHTAAGEGRPFNRILEKPSLLPFFFRVIFCGEIGEFPN